MVVEGELEAGRGAGGKSRNSDFPVIHPHPGWRNTTVLRVGGWELEGRGMQIRFSGVEKCLVCSFTLGWVLAYVDVRLREEEEGRVRKPEGGHKISGRQSSKSTS